MATIGTVDPLVIALILIVVVPVAVVLALAKSASLRGPAPRPESRVPVETLVTEAVPEDHPEDEDDAGYQAESDSPPPATSAG